MAKIRVRLSLPFKIISLILLIVVGIGAVTVYFVGGRMNGSLFAAKKETIKLVSIEQTHELKQILSSARVAADAVPSITGVVEYLENKNRKPQDEEVLRSLNDFGMGKEFLSVYLMDLTGLTYASTDPTLININFGFRKYFQNALKGEVVSEMVIGSITKEPGFYFSSPVVNKRGTIVGVAVVKMNPEPVYTALVGSYINELGKYMLVNDDGVIIYTNKEGALYKSLGVIDPEIKKQIEDEKRYLGEEILPLDYDIAQKKVEAKMTESFSYEFYDEEDKLDELIEMNRVGDYPLYFVSEVNSNTVRAVVAEIVRTVILFIVSILLLGLVIQILVLRKMLSPLSKLDKYAKNVTAGNLSESIVINTGDEMESLANSIREMVASLKVKNVELEEKVAAKTAELEKTLASVEGKNADLENTKKAVLNVMEDLSIEKDRMVNEKNRVETILSSIGDGVFVTDVAGRVIMLNKAAQEMSGSSLNEAFGKYYTETLVFRMENDQEKDYPDFVKKVLDTGVAQSLANHTVIVNKDKSVISVLDSAAPILDVDGKIFGCVVVFRNNSRERELEKNKDDFLSVTSHQLRTPLGSMRWNLEMLLGGDAGELSSEAKTIAEEIHKGNLRMIELVNDLLNVNRIDQGRVMDEPVKTDIGEVINKAVSELDFESKARKIKINLSLGKVPEVVIDPKRFREVMSNLISNAVKYNKAGGRVDIDLKQVGETIQLVIADNGVGIPEKDQSNLFTKFFRASNAVHSETEGSGLGLYVVKKFVEGWGGKIELKSKENEGTTITVTLPLDKLK